MASDQRTELLARWCREAGIMHIAHHQAASRCATLNLWLGGIASALAALVGSTVFASLATQATVYVTAATGALSMLAAILMALQTFLKFADRAHNHVAAAANFQRVRRECEGERARLEDGASGCDRYPDVLRQWQEAIRTAPPLPQRLHNRVKRNFEADSRSTKC